MSTDADESYHLPGATPQYLLPQGEPAQVRETPHAPHPDRGGLAIPADMLDVLEVARREHRIARDWFNDAVFVSIRPALMRLDDQITGHVRQVLGDELMDLFEEVRSYVPHRRHR